MVNAITRKLHQFKMLGVDDAVALDRLTYGARSYSPRKDIVSIGSKPDFALAILSGWAIRYTALMDGSRQITGFLLPGDFCHLNLLSEAPMDDSVAPLSSVIAAHIKRGDLADLFIAHPSVAKAAQASQCADEARLRASIASLGRQNAEQRLGYLLCDLWSRADAVDLLKRDWLDFPATQADIADCIGLTSVHVSRTMQRLRRDGLLEMMGRQLTLPDFDRLARSSGYPTETRNDRRYQGITPSGHIATSRQAGLDSHSPF